MTLFESWNKGIASMGRSRKLRPRIVNDLDLQEWEKAVSLYACESNAKTRLRVVDDFVIFARLNGVADNPVRALQLYAGMARRDTVEWSTIDTYVGYIGATLWSGFSPAQKLGWKVARDVIRAAHADSDTKSARTATASEICRILPLLPARERLAVGTVAFTGARLADVRRWRSKQTIVSRDRLKVEVRIAKNRRRRALRKILRLNRASKVLGLTLDPFFVQTWTDAAACPEERPLQEVTVSMVNAELKKVCQRLSIDRLTTYSFRKFFIRRVINHCDFDWPRIIQLTLHTNVNVVAAHYDNLLGSENEEREA